MALAGITCDCGSVAVALCTLDAWATVLNDERGQGIHGRVRAAHGRDDA